MIDITQLSERIQNKLNEGQNFYNFRIVCDTAEFKKPKRKLNDITEYINGLFTTNGSDVSTLNSGLLVSTLNCTLRIIIRMKGFEENELSEPDKDGNREILVYGDNTRIALMRSYLDNFFKANDTWSDTDKDGKEYVVSAVYDFAQSGIRGQVEHLGDSFTFLANVYYTIVQQGINSQSAIYLLDGVIIPYQSVTNYRTPTMDGNVYAGSKDGATKNLSSQSTLSFAFELPALSDTTTNNMLDFLFDGELNQAHLLTQNVKGKKKTYLVTYGETKLIGQTIQNLGQSLSLVECPDDYDLIHFSDSYYIYRANMIISELSLSGNGQLYSFGTDGGPFNVEENNGEYVARGNASSGSYIVSTVLINVENSNITRID